MKSIFKKVVLWLLKVMAKRRLKKFRGKVVAVTGSVGKTSTKEAIYTVLNTRYKVKRNEKSMNTDFGLLLTILDIESGFSSVRKWSWYLMKAFFHSFFKDHSEILLVEMGVDTPGDMDFLTSVVRPDVAIMTNIFPVHLAQGQFKDLNHIFEEKRKMVDALREGGTAILNVDSEFLAKLAKARGKRNTLTFARDNVADFEAKDVKMSLGEGLSFILNHGKERYEVKSKVVGEYQVYVLMPAIACGQIFGISIEDAIAALGKYELPPGRLNIIPGRIAGVTILDSSYNSSPESLKEALKVLSDLAGKNRRVAVLGNMNELGENSKEMHMMIGELVPKYVDILITVGGDARLIGQKALEGGMAEENVQEFSSANEAVEFFEKLAKKNDVILVKGSQNKVRLERFVKAFMANPEDADELLVRQEKVWEMKI